MRSWACQFGLSLAVLIAWPLLGISNQAQAAFLVRPPGWSQSASETTDMGSGDDRESNREADKQLPNVSARLGADTLWWAGNSPSGAGCSGTSGAPSGAGSVLQVVALFSPVHLSPLQVVRWLYFEDVDDRPVPFPSRLFRPPRVA